MLRKCLRGRAFFPTIRIGERYAIDVAGKRLKAGLVWMRFAGERHGQQRSAMERILKANYRGTPGISTRDLDGVLHRLGTGVDAESFLGRFARRQRVQFFRESDVAFVRSHGTAQL